MKTIKIIDLLNLVYEDKAPKKIYHKCIGYKFDKEANDYINEAGLHLFAYLFNNKKRALFFEAEIAEEKPEKIEEIPIQTNRTVKAKDKFIENMFNHFYKLDLETRNKLNEIIKDVNYILEKSDSNE